MFYLVTVTPYKYKVTMASESLEDVLLGMKEWKKSIVSCGCVIRDGVSGKRYGYADFFDTWTGFRK